MGMPGWKELLIILLVVLLVFGAKKLRTIGSDLGAAIRGFKKAMNEGEAEEERKQLRADASDADFAESKTRNSDQKA
ncbi:MAG TPA: twin-arginine translocase TatA/TatE family subunit [Steroidobacteraceae bacterium]